MRRLVFVLLCVAAAGVVSACAIHPAASPEGSALPIDRVWSAEDYQYRLSPGDALGVRFLLSPDLNTQVTIGPDGSAVLPLVARVRVGGLTIEQADAAVSSAYGAYLRKPLVELLVYGYAGGQVYVAGEVKTPGARAIRGQTSLVQVIEDGGGFTDTARVDAVVVLRRRPNGRVLMHQVDVKAILEGRSDEDMHLLPGDVVFVPRSSIAEVDRIVRQYITGVLPFNIDYQANGAVAGSVIR